MARFAPIPTRFLRPCEHRIPNTEANIEAYMDGKPQPAPDARTASVQPLCMLLTKEFGHTHAINPKVCAMCQFKGEAPDDKVLAKYATQGYEALLELCHLGFYAEADVLDLFKRAYPHMKKDGRKLLKFVDTMQNCVAHGRMSLEKAEKLATDHMGDLNESLGKATAGGGASKHTDTHRPPDGGVGADPGV